MRYGVPAHNEPAFETTAKETTVLSFKRAVLGKIGMALGIAVIAATVLGGVALAADLNLSGDSEPAVPAGTESVDHDGEDGYEDGSDHDDDAADDQSTEDATCDDADEGEREDDDTDDDSDDIEDGDDHDDDEGCDDDDDEDDDEVD